MTPERWVRIKEVFTNAAERVGEARAAYMEEACGADEELRREVESLLRERPDGPTFERPIRKPDLSGRSIAHYHVLEKLGEGGMGEVWKAEDTQLRRTVALKFLSFETIGNDEVKVRLIREAQASASLDHPNICAVHGIHEESGRTFIAMAFINGPSLAEKIKERPLPLAEALDIAIQIAAGIQEAHEKGVVHRDIKPHNIMLTAKGQVKVMDFGLASLVGRSKLTKSGTMLGTPAYMAPEQLQARPVDHRADIWALGCVLYEMLTQRTPFAAEYEQAMAYRILSEEPEPVSAQRADVKPELDQLIAKTLAKDPDERYQDADDLLADLRVLQKQNAAGKKASGRSQALRERAPSPEEVFSPSETGGAVSWKWLPWAVATLMTVALGALVWSSVRREGFNGLSQKITRATINLPDGVSLSRPSYVSGLAISPDGETIVFAGQGEDSVSRLYARPLNSFNVRVLPGTEASRNPVFSPDGERVAFLDGDNVIHMVSLSGGRPQVAARLEYSARVLDWPDDRLLFGSLVKGAVLAISPVGVSRKLLVESLVDTGFLQYGRLLPSGGAMLYSAFNSPGNSYIGLYEFSTGRREILIERGTAARYVPTGHLVHVWNGELLAVRFDPDRLRLAGQPVSVVQGLYAGEDVHHWDVSQTGTLVYAPGEVESRNRHLAWVDRNSAITPLPFDPAFYRHVSLSPNGRSFVVGTWTETPKIFIGDLERNVMTPFTQREGDHPVWTPDGKAIIFSSRRDGGIQNVYRKAVGSDEGAERLTRSEFDQTPVDVSPDCRWVAFREWSRVGSQSDISLLDLENGNQVRPLRKERAYRSGAVFSPNGNWIAYVQHNPQGSARFPFNQSEVYVASFPEGTVNKQASAGGGSAPRWAPDGRSLYYRLPGSGAVIQVPVTATGDLALGQAVKLVDGPFLDVPLDYSYDVAPDDKRFLMVLEEADREQESIRQLRVVWNWFDELERLVR